LFSGILSNFELIESVQVEFKDSLIGDHFSPAYSPRLRKLGVSGSHVDNIAIGAFAGITRCRRLKNCFSSSLLTQLKKS
jgi:hypothetical protein